MNYEILLDNFTDPVSDGVTFTWDAPVLPPPAIHSLQEEA